VLAYVLIGLVFGVVTEAGARFLKLWVYHQPQTLVLNVIVVFGLIMGAIATLVPRYGMLPAFVIGCAVGFAYEVANLAFLKWWDFPGERLGFIRGHAAIVLVLSLGWGLVPVATAKVYASLPRPPRVAAPRQSPMDKLNEREKALIEKLEALRNRERDVESRLDDVRRRKQLVLEKQTVRKIERPPTRPTAQPTPTP
jgi:hypothetical protein